MTKYKYSCLIIFVLLSVSYVGILFPGYMSDDSYNILTQANNFKFGDHHPPMMALAWYGFNQVYDGQSILFLFNMAMLWGSLYLMIFKIFKGYKYRSLIMIIPFLPQILFYAPCIWKDISFTFGYIFLGILLNSRSMENKRLNIFETILFFIILFYTTAVKYQAQFIAPIMLFWFVLNQVNDTNRIRVLLATFILSGALVSSINITNSYLVNNYGNGSNNSWQCVKIFDLARMSTIKGELLIPKVFEKEPNLSLKDLEPKFHDYLWETYASNGPYRLAKNQQELKLLQETWVAEVIKNPRVYLQHRFQIWFYGMVNNPIGKIRVEKTLGHINFVQKIIVPIFNLNSLLYLLPIMILGLVVGFNFRDSNYTEGAWFFSIMALTLIVLLFFKSLAAVPRYLYFAHVLIIYSVPFSICGLALLKRTPLTNGIVSRRCSASEA